MAYIRVTHSIDDLADDLRAIPARAAKEFRETVRDGVKAGNELAKTSAKRSAGTHGKHYHKAFGWNMLAGGGLFGNTYSGEYGPDVNMRQGGMSFEFGSRNQPPHLDLAKSADVIGPIFVQEVGRAVDRLFW